MTRGLPSGVFSTVVSTLISAGESSCSFLSGVVIAPPSSVSQTSSTCVLVDADPVAPDVQFPDLLPVVHDHVPLLSCPPTPTPHTLSKSCPSCHAPLRFKCRPSPLKPQSSTQLLGSTNVTPSVLATHPSLSFAAQMRRHETSLLLNTPLKITLDDENLDFVVLIRSYIYLPLCNPGF